MANFSNYDYDLQGADLQRKQQLIDAMQAASLQPLQTNQQAGGMTVPISPLEGIAKVAQAYMAKQRGEALKAQKGELAERYKNDLTEGMKNFYETSQGKDTPSMVLAPNADGSPQMQHIPGDRRKAIFDALAANHPVLRDLGMKMLTEEAKSQLTPKDLLTVATPESILANQGNTAAWKPKRELKAVAPGEVLLDSSGNMALPGNPTGNAGPSTVNVGGDLYQQTATGLKKLDNAPKVNVNASPVIMGQKAGAQEYFKHAATQVDAMGKEANQSQRLLSTLGTLHELQAAGINQGITSDLTTKLQNLGQAMGVKVDANRLGNTEAYNSLITDLWQRSVSQFGGNRGVTAAEAEEIKKLTPLAATSPQAKLQIMQLQASGAQRSIEAYKQANQSFAQAAAADDPRLFKIPDAMQGVYTPAAGQQGNPQVANPAGTGGAMSLDAYLRAKGM